MPAGQGVGAIQGLIPAGDLVRQIMSEAEQTLSQLSKLRSVI
jgi:NAD(P)H-dependent flavin oxidoreductase YrpB (nitropropane dioxygenase family)